jgi:DNA-binding transcriptional regulator YdaS (Cro superfamily)
VAELFELKSILIRYYGSQKAAAVALGLSESALCHIVGGKRKPSRAELEYISRALAKKLFQVDESDWHRPRNHNGLRAAG